MSARFSGVIAGMPLGVQIIKSDGQGGGDGLQEAVLWPRRADDGLSTPDRPPDDEQ